MNQTSCLRRVGAAILLLMVPIASGAQDSTRTPRADSTKGAAKAPTPAPALPFDVSGVIYTYFQQGGLKGARAQDRFGLDRAYFTLRGNAGERVAFRITTDVYQQQDTLLSGYYRGWAIRAKYAYVQYDFLRGTAEQLKGNVRMGLVHTVEVDHEEQLWPRGLQQVAAEQVGFFSSSDEGIAATLTLPRRWGEFYANVSNGTGYGSRELDRFKDYAARLTLTPFAKQHGYFKGLDVSPWFSVGDRASDFADRNHGTVRRVDQGQRRDRYGLLVQVRDPRVALGWHLARRVDIVETADTLRATTPTATERRGTLSSMYALVHPFSSHGHTLPVSVVARADDFTPDGQLEPYQRFYMGGVTWELNKKTSVTFDYQTQEPRHGSRVADLKTYYIHVVANF